MSDQPIINESTIFNIDNIQDVFLISDTHFNHIDRVTGEDRIAKYCGRPSNWKDMVISNWNKNVNSNDTVLHLGDFTFGSKNETKDIRDKLNGNIYLLKGNHDRHSHGWYKNIGIELIKKPFYIKDGERTIIFSHRKKSFEFNNYNNFHGHSHEKCAHLYCYEDKNIHSNLSVEVINYNPIKFKHLYKKVYFYTNMIYSYNINNYKVIESVSKNTIMEGIIKCLETMEQDQKEQDRKVEKIRGCQKGTAVVMVEDMVEDEDEEMMVEEREC